MVLAWHKLPEHVQCSDTLKIPVADLSRSLHSLQFSYCVWLHWNAPSEVADALRHVYTARHLLGA